MTVTERVLPIDTTGHPIGRPEHLGMSLKFLESNHDKYPFEDIVKISYPLEEINEAVKTAGTGEYIRVGIKLYK